MRHPLRVIVIAVVSLLLAGCLSAEPKVDEIEQVSADQRAAMQQTEAAAGEGEAAEGGAGPTQFVAIDIDYSQAPTEVAAGTVAMSLVNEGTIQHDVAFEELGDTVVLDAAPGATDDAEVELEPGEYTYFCTVAGHRAAGMEGTLTVTE